MFTGIFVFDFVFEIGMAFLDVPHIFTTSQFAGSY